jgi:surfactin synthase thioesterase subunit
MFPKIYKFCFVGHSLGGSVCYKLASKFEKKNHEIYKKILSIIAIDSIEGTAKSKC